SNTTGGIIIAQAQGRDLTVTGGITGQTRLGITSIAPALAGLPELQVIVDQTDAMQDAFVLANADGKVSASAGMRAYDYHLANRSDGAWLERAPGAPAYSPGGKAILNSASLGAVNWFHAIGALHKRMGDIRAGAASRQDGSPAKGGVWFRANGGRLNAGNSTPGLAFTQYHYGLTAGLDTAWTPAGGGSLLLTGAFLDTGGVERDFDGPSDGSTRMLGAGLYATWLHQDGWYADLVAKHEGNKHEFDTNAPAPDAAMSADYRTRAQGISLEVGRSLVKQGGWWVEPALQAAIVWLGAADYTTKSPVDDNNVHVRLEQSTVAQYRAQLRAGRVLDGGRWTPYVKAAAAYEDTRGGALHAEGGRISLGRDGWRAEFGAGLSCRLGRDGQLYFDYEYTRASDYERPWLVHLGYRKSW
ncbi:MAG: autotransporter outer membrane beta-barrel domain-containing protein, partial [Opitutaceae bacterium]|nr:autotransporter outer membrane beta-barrel domain-containing protein [Opitutaceae bacterium]